MGIIEINRKLDDLNTDISKTNGKIHNLDIQIVNINRANNPSTNVDKIVDK